MTTTTTAAVGDVFVGVGVGMVPPERRPWRHPLFLLVPGRAGRRGQGGGIGDCGGRHAGGGEDNGKATGVGGAMTDCSDAHADGGALTFSSAIIGSS